MGHGLTETDRAPERALTPDGTPNVWKYVLAIDPRTPLASSPFSPRVMSYGGERYFSVQFIRQAATEGVQYGLSASVDLQSWREVESALEKVLDLEGGMQMVRLTALHALGNAERQFYRPSVRLNSRAIPVLTGPPVPVWTGTIPSTGGEVRLDGQAGPLAGMQLTIPEGAYSNSVPVQISYQPILEYPLSDKITPVTPLITIDNGGAYSDQPMTVRVPIQITTNEFAMGFLCDPQTGQFEGLPIASAGPDHITISTHHFSSFVVSVVSKKTLPDSVNSGFAPGVDDWEFVNVGSYLAPNGHCSGQSLSAMWYYCEKRRDGAPALYNRFDNSLYSFPTPQVQTDNVLGYTLASVIQTQNQMFWNPFFKALQDDAETTYLAFKYSIWVTQEPQYVSIWGTNGGHAMVVYAVSTNVLKVADPNYPGNISREIVYEEETNRFSPYYSGPNATDLGHPFPDIFYVAKTAKCNWQKIGAHWGELESGSILEAMPEYGVAVYADASRKEEIAAVSSWHPTAAVVETWLSSVSVAVTNVSFSTAWSVIGEDGKQWPLSNGLLNLKPGMNRVGVRAYRVRTDGLDKWYDWLGFTWLNIERKVKDPNKTFTADVVSPNFLNGTCHLHVRAAGGVYAPVGSWINITTNTASSQVEISVIRVGSKEPVEVIFTPEYDLTLYTNQGDLPSEAEATWEYWQGGGLWTTTITNPRIKIGNIEDQSLGGVTITVPGGREFNEMISFAVDYNQTYKVDTDVQTFSGSGSTAARRYFLKLVVQDW